jgi:hypothetical protein
MNFLSEEGRKVAGDVAERHDVSPEAVAELLRALAAGGGTQAQFSHPDLGGMGQWSQGGMTMVGDMFNNGLKAKVDALCTELSGHLRSDGLFAARPVPSQAQSQSQRGHRAGQGTGLFVSGTSSSNWWPEGLGSPASVGSQNDLRYAFFPATRRLAISVGGKTTVHDTGDHLISGYSQQQSGSQLLTFTSQHGLVRVCDLPVVSPDATASPAGSEADAEEPVVTAPTAVRTPSEPAPAATAASKPAAQASAASATEDDVFAKIEQLATLHQKGILNATEFEAKKSELLARI